MLPFDQMPIDWELILFVVICSLLVGVCVLWSHSVKDVVFQENEEMVIHDMMPRVRVQASVVGGQVLYTVESIASGRTTRLFSQCCNCERRLYCGLATISNCTSCGYSDELSVMWRDEYTTPDVEEAEKFAKEFKAKAIEAYENKNASKLKAMNYGCVEV